MDASKDVNKVMNTKILALQNQVAFLSLTVATMKAQLKEMEAKFETLNEVKHNPEPNTPNTPDDLEGYETDEPVLEESPKPDIFDGMSKQQYIIVSLGSLDDSETDSGYDSDEVRTNIMEEL